MPTTTPVFNNGNSQAVRIPQQFRLDVARVEISRNAQGELVLRPVIERRGAALLNALDGFDDEFVAVLEEDRRQESAPMQERADL